jgi:hypothetical protein
MFAGLNLDGAVTERVILLSKFTKAIDDDC